jgi:hypothetical protein
MESGKAEKQANEGENVDVGRDAEKPAVPAKRAMEDDTTVVRPLNGVDAKDGESEPEPEAKRRKMESEDVKAVMA